MKIMHDMEMKQITFLDERFYTLDNKTFYPSVTTVLDAYPKGYGFIQWLKDLGSNADDVVRRAAEQGSRIHGAINRLAKKEELRWKGDDGQEAYSLDEWMMILKVADFWQKFQPEVLATEESICSPALGVGGTLDLVVRIKKEPFAGIWLIDAKSGNAIYKSHELQLAVYRKLWNEKYPDKQINRSGVLHLKAMTRGEDKTGKKMQGQGWCVKEFERGFEDAYKVFLHVFALWKEENPVIKPKNIIYPDRVQFV